jgi:hypothetical protein
MMDMTAVWEGVTVLFVPLVLVFCIFLVKDSGFKDKRDKRDEILHKFGTNETKN